jgi:hypothetical protein
VPHDLLFWIDHVVTHLLDTCLRWSATLIMEDCETATVLNAITHIWIRMFDLKPKGKAHAQMIEWHNALMRDALYYIDGQMMRNGIAVPPQAMLDEAPLAPNCLILIQGAD